MLTLVLVLLGCQRPVVPEGIGSRCYPSGAHGALTCEDGLTCMDLPDGPTCEMECAADYQCPENYVCSSAYGVWRCEYTPPYDWLDLSLG